MSKPFIHDDFMLETAESRTLFHDYAEALPILDYHCHLPPTDIADDTRWENLAQVWLYGDHYKWRAMRTNGVPERFCTGDASDWEKFEKWAETVPRLLRNPLYHWTHFELARYFDIRDVQLSPETASDIWDRACSRMAEPDFSCRNLMITSDVVLVCTTDDPTDDLAAHRAIARDDDFPVRVYPTWRPDKGMAVEAPAAFNTWVDGLAEAADVHIRNFDSYLDALRRRHAFFHETGCRLSDHGIETAYGAEYTDNDIRALFDRLRSGGKLDPAEVEQFKSAMLVEFGRMDADAGWTQQFHFGAMRNNNTRMYRKLGPDTGFDSIADEPLARPLSRLLDRLDSEDRLPRTVLYNLNPRDNALLATMIGNFQDGSIPGKLQFGSAWWFLDHKDGMERQIEDLSNMGLLSRFVGMLTDSRSFLSYSRHEYFRRILCNVLGRDMAAGLVPNDMDMLGNMVRDISYRNAARYFGFDVPGI